ncbi:MAG: hypothetical protein LAO21_06170 [Acidobacteriia bacterium]|nr:hypothetical protein [Terriglobia bacterium]
MKRICWQEGGVERGREARAHLWDEGGMTVQNLQPMLAEYSLSLEQAARTSVFVGVSSGFCGVQQVPDGQVI